MKRAAYILAFLALALNGVPHAFGQSYSVRLVQNVVGGNLDVDIEIGNASADFVLGTSSFVIDYNTAGLSTPTKANDGPWDNGSDDDYNNLSLSTGTGFAGLTVDFAGGDDNNGPAVTAGFQRVGTIRFPVVSSSESSGLSWRNVGSNTQVFKLTDPGISSDQTDITGNGTFIAPDDVPLPITLTSFQATLLADSRGVKIDWRTESEINNYGFYVQRRLDEVEEFSDLAESFVPGHGTTTQAHEYSYVDATGPAGVRHYRLKQMDLDRSVHFSEAITVDILTDVEEVAPPVFVLFQNYPNPFNPATEVKFSVETTGPATVRLYNVAGQEVRTLFEGTAEVGRYYRIELDGRDLASGIYIYRLRTETHSDIKKMVLLK
jgi:hypothetical protein